LGRNDEGWQTYFQQNNINPLIIFYEDLAENYTATVVNTLRWLGIPAPDDTRIAPPRLKKQSDDITEEWYARYSGFNGVADETLIATQ
jgi:LPS sulfotransferase NodH